MNRIVTFLFLAMLSGALLSGCNTTRGVGEDIKELGGIISDAAS
ncbi:entericidin A/B family lipoprotein [Entomohabitans teleogrylli]|nr:entericidin A/B family lipoprotein [Entomohabitans teleogrylli]